MNLIILILERFQPTQFGLVETFLFELAVLVVFLFLFFIYKRLVKSKKEITKKPIEELTQEIKELDQEIKEVLSIIDPSDYTNSSLGESATENEKRFFNVKNEKLIIRIIEGKGNKYEDKDKIIFASSLAYHFNNDEKRNLMLVIPEIVAVDTKTSHELVVIKSSAVNFSAIQDAILRFLFKSLNSTYSWMTEKQYIYVSKYEKKVFHFRLQTKTYLHRILLNSLSEVPGVLKIDNLSCTLSSNNYTIEIKKNTETWENLLPVIKEIFKDYFKAGVEFTGFDVKQK